MLRMILSENRFPLFGIMRILFAHDLVRKPVPTFRDHADFILRMISSENPFPLFGIMRYGAPREGAGWNLPTNLRSVN